MLIPIFIGIYMRLLAAITSSLLMAACGGGGGGGGGNSSSGGNNSGGGTDTGYTLVTPTKLTAYPSTGSLSYIADKSDYGIGTVTFPRTTEAGSSGYPSAIYNPATSTAFQVYPVVHLTNEVRNAWSNGWTGAGITISVIDDFLNSAGNISISTPVISRSAIYEVTSSDFGMVQGTYDMVYQYSRSFSHGAIVSNIAGGDADGAQLTQSAILPTVKSVASTACSTLRAGPNRYTLGCDSDFYIQTFGTTNRTFDLTYKKVAGVAKQSLVVDNNVNLSSRQNPIQTVADIQGHLKNSAFLGVINLSLGSDIPTSGKSFDQVMAEVARFPLSKVDAVVTVAAGNGGAPCATQDLNGCNSLAVAMAYQSATAASTIVVGATSGSGSSENIATYSTRAGVLAQRFVLASGEEGSPNMVGTSFAAPRVAGIAAILKQKFPLLTSAQVANVILLSASKDINNDGVDDFTGVSPIYGHGKASLTRALALAGAI
jgi:subtilisin family serine protease